MFARNVLFARLAASAASLDRSSSALVLRQFRRALRHAVLQLVVRFPEGFLGPFAVGDVAHALDRAVAIAVGIQQGSRRDEDVGPAPAVQSGDVALGENRAVAPLKAIVVRRNALVRGVQQVDRNWLALPVEGDRVGEVRLPQHLLLADSRHLLDGPIPGDDAFVLVDDERGVRQKLDDVLEPPVRDLDLLLRPPALEQLPHPLHQQLQLPHVGFVVGLLLVADSGDDDDPLALEDGQVHVPLDVHVPSGIAFLQGIRGGIVVGDDGLPLPDGFAPQPRVHDGVNDRLVDDLALRHRRFRPGVHGQHRLVAVHESQVADPALRQPHRLFEREIRQLLQRGVAHLTQADERLEPGFVQPQTLFRLLALRLDAQAAQGERDVSGCFLQQSPLFVRRGDRLRQASHQHPRVAVAAGETHGHRPAADVASPQRTIPAVRGTVPKDGGFRRRQSSLHASGELAPSQSVADRHERIPQTGLDRRHNPGRRVEHRHPGMTDTIGSPSGRHTRPAAAGRGPSRERSVG